VSAAVAVPRRDLRAGARACTRAGSRAAAPAVLALAAGLRVVALSRTPLDPFYDAAVRSMGTSWHAFLVGAFDPSARVAIDKPPFDLWLQVAATKLFGFGPFALLLPAALGGTLAVAALYDLVRTLISRRAGLAAALALAVLPVSVISSRSDTMDSVMAALLVGAFAIAARGLRHGGTRHAVAAGALVGLAFEVKLFEALVAALPLAAMWALGAAGERRRRLRQGAAGAAACVVVGLGWLVVMGTLVPPSARPWAFGSTDGSAWHAALVYDGWDRLAHATPGTAGAAASASVSALQRVPASAGPLRLLSARDHLGSRLGVELAAAWLAVALAVATRAWRGLDRAGRAGLIALCAWLALGTVLFSGQSALRPRYLEAFDPAVAACLGAGIVLAAGALGARMRSPGAAHALAAALAALLVAPLATSVQAVAAHVEDSGAVGAMPSRRVAALTAYLRVHRDGARYEVASLATSPAASIIVHDGRPVLILTALGHPLETPRRLAELVAAGQVHTALAGAGCRTAGCARLGSWIRAHGVDVGGAAGQPRGVLYALSAGPRATRASSVRSRISAPVDAVLRRRATFRAVLVAPADAQAPASSSRRKPILRRTWKWSISPSPT
jgi:4-amino-4-deoxy-L-arabinose transferase-like glycosyltransferase